MAHVLDLMDVIVATAIGTVRQRIEHGVASLGRRFYEIYISRMATPPHSATPDQP